MEATLVNKVNVRFEDVPTQHIDNGSFVSVKGTVNPIWPNLSDLKVPNKFTKLLQRRELFDPKIKNMTADIEFGIMLSDNLESLDAKDGNGFLKVQDQQEFGLFQILSGIFGKQLSLRVHISQIYKGENFQSQLTLSGTGVVSKDDTAQRYGIRLQNMDIQGDFFKLRKIQADYRITYHTGSYTDHSRFGGVVSIMAIIDHDPIVSVDDEASAGDHFCINRKMLNEEIACDVIIIPENGVGINCHKGFLIAHSSVLATMFKTTMTEAKTNTIEIPDMTEEAVRALLEYLYYWETKQAKDNPSICFELLHAAHKYDIPKLEMSMKQILLSKPVEWYEVEMSLKLFLFARNLEDGKELKQKAVQALKSMNASLEESPTYQEMFTKNPKAAMELCKCAFAI